mmetsp:Transcript_36930/g.105765  ORF Transcript_36930/g.105765 Transcript_36930/m.105765 type:complete len:206 (+) Transcript_36930:106-723(+)
MIKAQSRLHTHVHPQCDTVSWEEYPLVCMQGQARTPYTPHHSSAHITSTTRRKTRGRTTTRIHPSIHPFLNASLIEDWSTTHRRRQPRPAPPRPLSRCAVRPSIPRCRPFLTASPSRQSVLVDEDLDDVHRRQGDLIPRRRQARVRITPPHVHRLVHRHKRRLDWRLHPHGRPKRRCRATSLLLVRGRQHVAVLHGERRVARLGP